MKTATRIVTDSNGRIIEAADNAGELLGIDDRWLVGKPLAAFVPEPRRREFRRLLLDLAHGGGPTGLSLELLSRNGEHLTLAVEAVAEARGERVEWQLASPDGEDGRSRRRRSLPHAEPLGRLLARLPVGIVSVDSDLHVEYLNPAARVYLGSGATGGLLPDPWPGFSLRKFARRLYTSAPPPRRIIDTLSGRTIEIDGIRGGTTSSALLIIQDVTGRERRIRAEREFATNAAHELRTPIAAIASAVEVLQSGAKESPDDRDLFLAHIERESSRLQRLAEALLLLARIQTGQVPPTLELVDIAPLLEEVAGQLKPSDGVVMKVSCPAGIGALADRDLLRQAVWNLASNAVLHTTTGRVVLGGHDLGRVTEIEVRDTGPGIPPVGQERVFERFYRGEPRGGSGFGLGLPIAREIATALGGTLTLDSEPGKGTHARLVLPSARVVST